MPPSLPIRGCSATNKRLASSNASCVTNNSRGSRGSRGEFSDDDEDDGGGVGGVGSSGLASRSCARSLAPWCRSLQWLRGGVPCSFLCSSWHEVFFCINCPRLLYARTPPMACRRWRFDQYIHLLHGAQMKDKKDNCDTNSLCYYKKKYGIRAFNVAKRTPSHPTKSHLVVVRTEKNGKVIIKVIRFGQ